MCYVNFQQLYQSFLRKILEPPAIRRVTNNIRGHAARLSASHAINLLNCAELSYVARHVDPARWPLKISTTQRLRKPRYWLRAPNDVPDNTRSLDRPTFVYTRHILVKDATLKNRHEGSLTRRMQEYAADDAHPTVTVFTAMPSCAYVTFHWYVFDTVEGRPYHIDISSPRKAWKADNEMVWLFEPAFSDFFLLTSCPPEDVDRHLTILYKMHWNEFQMGFLVLFQRQSLHYGMGFILMLLYSLEIFLFSPSQHANSDDV